MELDERDTGEDGMWGLAGGRFKTTCCRGWILSWFQGLEWELDEREKGREGGSGVGGGGGERERQTS